MSKSRELAELVGCHLKWNEDGGHYDCFDPNGQILPVPMTVKVSHAAAWAYITPDYPNDLNAMREVWKVLVEEGLWDEFVECYFCWDENDHSPDIGFKSTAYGVGQMLFDPEGQIDAAIKVLRKEAQ